MDVLVPYAVWAIIIVIGLGSAAILIFGLRAVVQGKARPLTIGMMAVPIVLFLVLGLAFGWAMGGIWTTIVMFFLGVIALLSSGLWGVFT